MDNRIFELKGFIADINPNEIITHIACNNLHEWLESWHKGIERTVTSVEVKSKTLVEQKHGRWIPFKLDMRGCVDIIHYECSNCHKIRGGQTMYCPRCGAKMEITE